MMELACQYSIVRFLPYAETGEFANVGIVLACPKTGYLSGKFIPIQRTKRITDFFEDLDSRIYRQTVAFIRTEVLRMHSYVAQLRRDSQSSTAAAFAELTRPREALVRFSPVRVVLASDPKAMLDTLFARFIERDFATKEYHEEVLNKGISSLLAKASLKSLFEKAEVGDDTISVRFPFVALDDGEPVLAIKALDLAKDEPSKIIDHGGHWVERVRRLRKHGRLPAGVLFAVDIPEENKQRKAAEEIVSDLRGLGTTVAAVKDESAILEFASQAKPPDPLGTK